MQPNLIALVCLLLPSLADGLVGFTQSSAVKGVLMCNDKPAKNVKVKLYDNDSGPDLDDLMDSGKTDADGRFSLAGHVDEFTTIDPKINVYHDCDDWLPCQRRISIYVPSKYVTKGSTPDKTYDAGVIQLAGKFSGETRDCLN
ncbi:hypothetical protein PRIPAC_96198 [Pristionchus pacificus]|uniref:Uncharacterized protein n=1 Tax=Pristionchus pacificus TaxID=54126 RepID=A0A454Y2B2_PRIPA|nr:hypothetical protein PRIPAC_96198 [Pristionchus pacificus]|eukprot:PDM65810.1 hypothetical protein PRIPAC_45211 [Pristionchus pacificus]